MKNKLVYSCLMVLALASGCIKEEGDEPFTITRQVKDAAKNDSIPLTVITEQNGFMYGDAPKDTIKENSFQTILSVTKNIENLDCYITMHSEFRNLNLNRNAVKEAGYVYSYSKKNPVLSDDECKAFGKKDISYNPADSTKENISFDGTGHNLEFNKPIFLRSYVVTCQGDTIYNPRVVETKTVLPEDVWFQRNDATNVTGRTECFVVNYDDKTYLYGGRQGSVYHNDMWVYDKVKDTWEQKGTFVAEGQKAYYSNTEKRANGAAFVYHRKGRDPLLYFAGGMTDKGPTRKVFYYNVSNNHFADPLDHPNKGKMYFEYNADGTPVYKKDKETGEFILDAAGQKIQNQYDGSRNYVEDLPIENSIGEPKGIFGCVGFTLPDDVMDDGYRVFVAYGKTNRTNVHPVETTIYEYDVTYDRTCTGIESSTMAWRVHSAGNDKTAQGFYQPVCVECGDRVVIGSGESSRNNNQPCKAFYTIDYIDQEIRLTPLPAPPEEFKSRANAAGFYLDYVKDGESFDRFFVGTGRTVSEEEFEKNNDYELLLNDLWCYDFTRKAWIKRANCSNIHRQGAAGFTVMRNDDFYFNTFGENQRGYFSFGEGGYEYYDDKIGQNETVYKYGLQDNWEYLP